MDNSLLYYRKKIEQLISEMERFSSNIRHHVIVQPKDTMSTAVHYGFPSDIAKYYMNRYYSKNIDDAEAIIACVERECIPYLKDVARDIENAMNLGGDMFVHIMDTSLPSSPPQELNTDSVLHSNNAELEKAFGIKQGHPMSITEADKQNANPNHKANQVEYLLDSNGEYVKVWNAKKGRLEFLDSDEWIQRGNDISAFDAEPHYKKNLFYQYSINCATCAAAYVLRLRGFDIKAKGNTKEDDNLNYWLSKGHSFDVWQNPDGSPVKPRYTVDWMRNKGIMQMKHDDYKAYFEETCKEKGVYILTLEWIDGGGHATILQRDEEGLHYIEPQEYDGRVKKSINELIFDLHPQPVDSKGILRVDDKTFNPNYVLLFDK